MCIQKNFLCKNENQNKPNGASPPIPSLSMCEICHNGPPWSDQYLLDMSVILREIVVFFAMSISGIFLKR